LDPGFPDESLEIPIASGDGKNNYPVNPINPVKKEKLKLESIHFIILSYYQFIFILNA
jgi:hypothetical protein